MAITIYTLVVTLSGNIQIWIEKMKLKKILAYSITLTFLSGCGGGTDSTYGGKGSIVGKTWSNSEVPEPTESTSLDPIPSDPVPLPPIDYLSLESDWHPDPDDDEVTSDIDNCPKVYNPNQSDVDGDNVGDFCDEDYLNFKEGEPVRDLHAQHVTPYGAWLRFRSPLTVKYHWRYKIVWSTDEAEVSTDENVLALIEQGDFIDGKVMATAGLYPSQPTIIRSLDSDTQYYVALAHMKWDGSIISRSNVVRFKTKPNPEIAQPNQHPTMWLSQADLDDARQRFANNDQVLMDTLNRTRAHVQKAAAGNVWLGYRVCRSAGILYHITQNAEDKAAALNLWERALTRFSILPGDQTDGNIRNSYRWRGEYMSACTDLMWDYLTEEQRNAAVLSMLMWDEYEDFIPYAATNLKYPNILDTDQFAANTAIQLATGLLACNAEGISEDLSERACAILDIGKRAWYGVQLPKARRVGDFFGQVSGYLPDGTEYSGGTISHWFLAIYNLLNLGDQGDDIRGFVRNNLFSMRLHAQTPSKKGITIVGDVEGHLEDQSEPYSFPIDSLHDLTNVTLQGGLLRKLGLHKEADWLFEYRKSYKALEKSGIALLYDRGTSDDFRDEIGTYYLDKGFGVMFDRNHWGQDATLFTARSGWGGVHHVHADVGGIQMYRKGRWILTETPSYAGKAAGGVGHSIFQLEIGDEGQFGQYYVTFDFLSKYLGSSSSTLHNYTRMQNTPAYNLHPRFSYYEKVERETLWLKGDHEVLIVKDFARTTDKMPAVNGRATFQFTHEPVKVTDNSYRIEIPETQHPAQTWIIDSLLPASLSTEEPEGPIGAYLADIPNWRLYVAPAKQKQVETLVVLQAGDEGFTPSVVTNFNSDLHHGAVVDNTLVLFAKNQVHGWQDSSFAMPDNINEIWLSTTEADTSFSFVKAGNNLSVTKDDSSELISDNAGLLRILLTD